MKRAALLVIMTIAACGAAFSSGTEEQEPRALHGSESILGIDTVMIDAGAYDVEVSAGRDPSVSIRADYPQDSFFDQPRGKVLRQRMGPRLRIQVTGGDVLGPDKGRLRLRVPRDIALRIKTRSGRIVVEGLENDVCDLSTVSGRVILRDIRGSVIVDSVSGDVTMDSLEGRLKVKTVSGSIRGRRVLFTEDSELSAVSGNIEIIMDNSPDDLSFDLSSVSGRIVIGAIRAERGLRMGFGDTTIRGYTVSGSLIFRD